MKILELFSGYGTASFALKQLGIPYECVGYSDIDKYANQCFAQNHFSIKEKDGFKIVNNPKELGDATKINTDELEDFDLLTGGFPCQAFSVAGKGLGELDTRGTLFREIIRIAEVKQPRYMLLENVKGLTNKNHKATFEKILSELHRIGYYVSWKVLNTKDFGIPQNRERVWFVCFSNFAEYAKFEFPEKEELKIFLKDILEEDVDEKYYLKEHTIKRLLNNGQGFRSKINQEVGSCLFASQHKIARGMDLIQVNNPKHSNNRVYSDEGISPTLRDMSQGGNTQPFIQIKNATKKGYIEAKEGDGVSLEQPNSKTRRGRVQPQTAPTLDCKDQRGVVTAPKAYDNYNHNLKEDGTIGTLGTNCGCSTATGSFSVVDNLTIRKLTPKECFRLQGFLNDEVNLEGLSNTQQYKLAGNGQSVNVVKKIFERMFL